jgi:hypothetical protein
VAHTVNSAPWRAGDESVKTTVYLSILCVIGCSKRSSGEAAADGHTAGVALGYVEDVDEVRRKLGTVFSSR